MACRGKAADVRQHACGGKGRGGEVTRSAACFSWSPHKDCTSMASVLASMRSCSVIGRLAMLDDAVVTLTQPRRVAAPFPVLAGDQ